MRDNLGVFDILTRCFACASEMAILFCVECDMSYCKSCDIRAHVAAHHVLKFGLRADKSLDKEGSEAQECGALNPDNLRDAFDILTHCDTCASEMAILGCIECDLTYCKSCDIRAHGAVQHVKKYQIRSDKSLDKEGSEAQALSNVTPTQSPDNRLSTRTDDSSPSPFVQSNITPSQSCGNLPPRTVASSLSPLVQYRCERHNETSGAIDIINVYIPEDVWSQSGKTDPKCVNCDSGVATMSCVECGAVACPLCFTRVHSQARHSLRVAKVQSRDDEGLGKEPSEGASKARAVPAVAQFEGNAAVTPQNERACSFLLTASADTTARIWDISTYQCVATLSGHSKGVGCAQPSPDGRFILTGSDDTTARIWDSVTHECVAILKGHVDRIRSATYSPDGQFIATASRDQTVRIWNSSSYECVAILTGHTSDIYSVKYSPNGNFILTVSGDKTTRIWSLTSECVVTLSSGPCWSASYSPDGRFIITASNDRTACIWSSASYQLVSTLVGHTGAVNSAIFSPDGKLIVTAADDRTARIWNSSSLECVGTLIGHGRPVVSASFSPDGAFIYTASIDKTAIIWNSSTYECVATLTGHSSIVWTVCPF